MKNCRSLLLVISASVLPIQWAQAADYINSIGMEFNNIPAGSFYLGSCGFSLAEQEANKEANKKRQSMGLPARELKPVCPSGGDIDAEAGSDEIPQHQVRITEGFQMGVYEVTWGQFNRFLTDKGYHDLVSDWFIEANNLGDEAPVLRVTWANAQDFIQWLNNKEGGNAYRLPTNAEWEYAARAGTTTKYFWGDSAGQAGEYAWFIKNSYDGNDEHAYPVGSKKPNPWGLYDTAGNAWEWVQDWYEEGYYRHSPTDNPTGPISGKYRIVRGGGYMSYENSLRSANFFISLPDKADSLSGFRLVRQP